ncbi:hypothetical protein GGD64_008305 [Bradyrhizobium sp. CIR3A]|nr:hypothetical protein [Bradyrhizobium sp. CIR3A]
MPTTSRRCATARYGLPPRRSKATNDSCRTGNRGGQKTAGGRLSSAGQNRQSGDACSRRVRLRQEVARAQQPQSRLPARSSHARNGVPFHASVPPCSGRSRPSLAVAANAASLERPSARRLRNRWPGRKNGPQRSRTKNGRKAIAAIVVSAMKKSLVHLIRGVQLGAGRGSSCRRARRLGVMHEGGELGHFGTELIGDLAPLRLGCFGSSWAKAVAMKAKTRRRPHLPARARTLRIKCTRQPPGGVEHLGDGHLGAEITSLTARRPRRASFRRNEAQNVSASDGPMSMPSTSRRPSLLTPIPTMTATETMPPF